VAIDIACDLASALRLPSRYPCLSRHSIGRPGPLGERPGGMQKSVAAVEGPFYGHFLSEIARKHAGSGRGALCIAMIVRAPASDQPQPAKEGGPPPLARQSEVEGSYKWIF